MRLPFYRPIFIFLIGFFAAINIKAQQLEWGFDYWADGQAKSTLLTTDLYGHVYTCGTFYGTAEFDPAAGSIYPLHSDDGKYYIQKLNTAGELIWVKQVSCTGAFEVQAMVTSVDGSIYITGHFGGTADVDPGPGVISLSTAEDHPQEFLLRFDGFGNLVWAKQTLGFAGECFATSLNMDETGNVLVTGFFRGSVDFDMGAGDAYQYAGSGKQNLFVQKLNSDGELLWVKSMPGKITGKTICTDAAGNIYAAGNFGFESDFDPGPADSVHTAVGNIDAFVLKLNTSGDLQWVNTFGGGMDDGVNDLLIDRTGNLVVVGYFEDTTDVDPGPGVHSLIADTRDGLMLKYGAANGDLMWASQFVGDVGGVMNLADDLDGNLYILISFKSLIDADPGAGVAHFDAFGGAGLTSFDLLVEKLDANGSFLWAGQLGGPETDMGEGFATDPSGNIYVSGWYQDNIDIDPGTGTTPLTNDGVDAFVVKWSHNAVGVPETTGAAAFVCYPNPGNGVFTLELDENFSSAQVSIFNTSGQLVQQKTFQGNKTSLTINGPSGLYLVVVNNGPVIRLVKE